MRRRSTDEARGKIVITLEAAELEAEGVSAEEVKKRIKAQPLAGSHMDAKDNVITIKPTTSSLRNIRRLTNKLRQLHIKGVEKINRTIVVKAKDGTYFIRTGAAFNIAAVMKNTKVEGTKLYSNDVQEIGRVLGIEAARNSLMNEIKQVLEMQNLNVDKRH